MKHTKGKWAWRWQNGNPIVSTNTEKGFEKLIAEIEYNMSIDQEAQANAHLIAAAPELLEALERFLESSACTNDCAPDDMTCDTNFARAVINKAKGK